MGIIGEIIGIGSVIGIALMVLAKVLPNEKLFSYGYSTGAALNVFGTAKLGAGWEKIEDFLINSIGEFLRGMKAGLDPEDNMVIEAKDKKKDVRK